MSSYLPTATTSTLSRGADLLRATVGSITWGPALSISKAGVTSLFSRIENGALIVDDETDGGRVVCYGQRVAKEHTKLNNGISGVKSAARSHGRGGKVELRVLKETFWVRVFLFADMGFAEAYMLGEVECADLTAFFQVCLQRFSCMRLPMIV